jgi:hypothetical protein
MSKPSDPIDHYAALGVPRTASTQEIKARYYELCKRLHPDARVPGEPDKWSRKGVHGMIECPTTHSTHPCFVHVRTYWTCYQTRWERSHFARCGAVHAPYFSFATGQTDAVSHLIPLVWLAPTHTTC